MSIDQADTLEQQILGSPVWPLARDRPHLDRIWMHRALRRSDEHVLRHMAGYTRRDEYVTDPLPALICGAFADLLFGTDPEFTSAVEQDTDALRELTEPFGQQLRTAERICSSEGEVWWRAYVDRAASSHPILQWVSRLSVVPLWRAGRLVACAFVTTTQVADDLWRRHVEIHADGVVRNLLLETAELNMPGRRVALTADPELADLPDEWLHPLPMLAGRVVNTVDDDHTIGRSDYAGVERMLLALNEAGTIAMKNARLTARKRIFADASVLDERGEFRVKDDIVITEAGGKVLGSSGTSGPPVSAVDVSFDAEALVLHINDLTDRVLTRVGVAPQLIGRDLGAGPESGRALRTRLLHSVLAAEGKGRHWDAELPIVLTRMQQLDALSEQDGGCGVGWVAPAIAPGVERGTVLPEDEADQVDRHAKAVMAEVESRRTAIEAMHPDWTDERVTEELALIQQDTTLPPIAA